MFLTQDAFIQQTFIKLLYGFPLSTHLLSTETDPGFYSGGAIHHPRDYISPVSLECKQLSRSAVSSGKASYVKLAQLSRAKPTPRLPWWLRAEESTCDTGDAGLTPELGKIT